jgi:hypothetical protein
MKMRNESVTVVGTVAVFKEDHYGDPLSVVIEADDTDYIVDRGGKGSSLLGMIGERVKISGTMSEDEDGNPVLKVTRVVVQLEDE